VASTRDDWWLKTVEFPAKPAAAVVSASTALQEMFARLPNGPTNRVRGGEITAFRVFLTVTVFRGREIDQRVEFRIYHGLLRSHRRNDGGGNFEHALGDRAMSSSAIGALVGDAGGQEHQLPFCGTQCSFAIILMDALPRFPEAIRASRRRMLMTRQSMVGVL